MPLSNIVNNIGIGNVEATFLNLTTTFAAGSATPFTQALIDNYRRAASLFGNNYVGHGTTTYNLFCAIPAVSENDQADKSFPQKVAGIVSGFADMQATTGAALAAVQDIAPIFQRAGFVVQGTTTFRDGRNSISRGKITEIFQTDRCVVLF